MDDSIEWAASGLFSPSKARAQHAQAKDWAFVDAWLARKYGAKRMPKFERNEGTLQTLLNLAAVNDAADERRGNVDRVEKVALQSMNKQDSHIEGLYDLVVRHADPIEPVDQLARLIVLLNVPSTDAAEIGAAIIDVTTKAFAVAEQKRKAKTQINALKSERARLQQILGALKSSSFEPPEDLPRQTAEWARNTKHLKAKLGEYEERLGSHRSAQ